MSRFDLTGRVAVVTGGSSGIGKAIALALAEEGANIVITARTRENVAQAAQDVQDLGRRSLGVPCDVREADQVASMVQQTMDAFGRIDILINNAGGSYGQDFKRGPVLDITERDLNETLRLNVNSVFPLQQGRRAHHAAAGQGRHRQQRLHGRSRPRPRVRRLHCRQGRRHEPHHANGHGVGPRHPRQRRRPGRINTARSASLRTSDILEWRLSHIAMGRMGNTDEVAGAVVYLASDAATWTTGAIIDIDGGRNHW